MSSTLWPILNTRIGGQAGVAAFVHFLASRSCEKDRRLESSPWGETQCPPKPPSRSDRKKLAAFSALGGGFLRFPIGDRRCNRTRASVGNAGGNARPSLTNARRPPSCSTDALACAVARVPTEDIISSAYASMRRESSRGSRRSASPGGLHLRNSGGA